MVEINSKQYFIGIDLGTGSAKAVCVDEDGKIIATSQYHYPTINPQPTVSEQNPESIWDAFVNCLNEVLGELNSAPSSISFSSAMHSIMPADAKGTALANAMLWADSRSAGIAAGLRASSEGEAIYKHTGTAIYAMSPLCKIIWLKQNKPNLFTEAVKFISIKEYIWFKLFGVFEVDHSVASATGMLDIIALEWYQPSLELAGIDSGHLSSPVSTTHLRFLTMENPMFPALPITTAFVIGATDGCCANLGGNAIRPGVAALTIGTSGAVRVGRSNPVYNYKAMTFNYLLNRNTYICGGAVNNGGAAVDWLLKSFLKTNTVDDDAYKRLFEQIEAVEAGSNGLLFLPYLYAERAPIWDASSSGAFLGINFKHQQQHFLRAALEGICFALYDVLQAVEGSSEPVSEIVVSGGFISSPVWVQILADITGKKLVLLQSGDSSAIGAVYLGMEALGVDIAPVLKAESESQTVVEPNAARHKTYSALFPIYKKLYDDLKDSMHQLKLLDL
ncbi:gluconokinase [Mucilaginibacter sp. PAMC 26640]|nr:gluconokinase [Mucilaginibacter sp. PAMC 26640]